MTNPAEAENIQAPIDDAWNETTDIADTANDAPEQEELVEEQPEPEEQKKPEKVFTQSELERKIEKRLSRMAQKHQREMESLKSSLRPSEVAPQPKQDDVKEPKRSDFEALEDYLEARSDYITQREVKKHTQALQEKFEADRKKIELDRAQSTFMSKADERVRAGQSKYSDFDEVLNDAAEDGIIVPGSELHISLVESDIGHDLAYYLSKPENRDEAEKLLNLPPRALHREIGKLEAKLTAKASETKKPRRPTMDTLEGRRNVNMDDPMRENMSTADFIAMRNKQEFGRVRR